MDDKLPALSGRTSSEVIVSQETGDQVYYKKGDSRYWKGPGTVLGMTINKFLLDMVGCILESIHAI